MAKVIDLERVRVEELATRLVPMLRQAGMLVANVAEVEDVDRWRRAVRRAARLLGWRGRTGLNVDGSKVWALSPDWPVPPGTVEAGMRRMSEMLLGPDPGARRRPGRRIAHHLMNPADGPRAVAVLAAWTVKTGQDEARSQI